MGERVAAVLRQPRVQLPRAGHVQGGRGDLRGKDRRYPGPDPGIVANQSNWHDPVLVTKQSSTTFSDKEQIWADNAESSPFFGNDYLCLASFRSNSQGNAAPQPLVVATSRDGGTTWTNKQVTPASNNPFNPKQGFGRSGCTVRTDSHGVV